MLHKIIKVEYLEGFKLKLHFSHEGIKIVDFSELLKNATNMLVPLLDVNYFKKVKCDGYTIFWPNEVDFCPTVLFKMAKNISPKRHAHKVTKKITARRKTRKKILR